MYTPVRLIASSPLPTAFREGTLRPARPAPGRTTGNFGRPRARRPLCTCHGTQDLSWTTTPGSAHTRHDNGRRILIGQPPLGTQKKPQAPAAATIPRYKMATWWIYDAPSCFHGTMPS